MKLYLSTFTAVFTALSFTVSVAEDLSPIQSADDPCASKPPPPDCIDISNPPSSSGGTQLDKTINLDASIFLNLPKVTLSKDGAPLLKLKDQVSPEGKMVVPPTQKFLSPDISHEVK